MEVRQHFGQETMEIYNAIGNKAVSKTVQYLKY